MREGGMGGERRRDGRSEKEGWEIREGGLGDERRWDGR
jgi:hypothetical protein